MKSFYKDHHIPFITYLILLLFILCLNKLEMSYTKLCTNLLVLYKYYIDLMTLCKRMSTYITEYNQYINTNMK